VRTEEPSTSRSTARLFYNIKNVGWAFNNIHDRYYVIAWMFCHLVILSLNSEYGDYEIECENVILSIIIRFYVKFKVELSYVGGNVVLMMPSNLG
jgi:hypothetical protein